jgi:hypothetical protein
MANAAVVTKPRTQIARPLKVLAPLIQEELETADRLGLEHYRHAGEMLIEARGQLAGMSWTRWLRENFSMSRRTADRYMKLTKGEDGDEEQTTLYGAIGEKRSSKKWKPLFNAARRVKVAQLAEARQSRDEEIKLHRDLAIKLIDLGYRALATRLHPDHGGSKGAMARLNVVRDELKEIAATRRFV